MGKIYESKANNRGLYGEKFKVKFSPDAGTINKTNPFGYGKLVSDDSHLLKQTQVKPEAIEKMIENEPDFKHGVPGVQGIWLREKRIAAEGKSTFADYRRKLREQGAAGLRQLIVENGGSAPATATLDELVTVTLNTLASPVSGEPQDA